MDIDIVADSISAGAYKSKGNMLKHAVPTKAIHIGKLDRGAGQALCKRSLDTVGHWQNAALVDCPVCLRILLRLGVL